jgi:hypothetical protein
MHATIRRRLPRYELPIPEAGAVVVTRRLRSGTWETHVEGGQLDGWTLATLTRTEAAAAHRGAVRLVHEAADLVGMGTG